MIYWSIRIAWADHLSYGPGLADRQQAARLAPAIAAFSSRIADKQQELDDNALPDVERAVSLDPENSDLRMHLGLRAELAGNFALAEQSLLAAALRNKLFQPRYLLAQFYFRRERTDDFWKWSRAALDVAPSDVTALLDLGWRTHPDSAWILEHAIPARPEILRQYLVFLEGKQQWEAAGTLSAQIATNATLPDRPILLDYCDRRLLAGNATDALAVWNALSQRALVPYSALDPANGPYLTGTTFDQPPLEAAFDWRRNNPPGVIFGLRNREIHLEFSGSQAEQLTILWQYVSVQPSKQYRLQFSARAIDAPGTDGVTWNISDVKGADVPETWPSPGLVQFQSAPNSVVKLALVYRRPRGSVPLKGSVAITSLTMEQLP